jgi:hypothetical protein
VRGKGERGESGGGGGESAGVVDLSSEELNMSPERVTVFKEITDMPLNSSVVELEFHGHYSQYRWEILSSPRTVFLLTLTRGPMSLATMVSEPASPLLAVESSG